MRSFYLLTLAASFAASLTGCAGTTEDQKKTYLNQTRYNLSDTPSCCESYASFNYVTLNKTSSKELDINSGSQAYNFKEGKSFFQAIKLPASINSYTVRLQTWTFFPDESAFENARFTFEPIVLFLDKNFNEIEHLSHLPLKHFESFTMNGREANIKMKGQRAKAQYMIVYTHPQHVGVPIKNQGGGMADFNYIMNDSDGTREITRSSEGMITVSIRR